ncbi:MAG TPA: hypothetical protein VMU26_07050 [Candidatus Polarisedimenticolia bacterium]|nr:hypothetical protein [Candidatus Polarisedimenticolia bacterium]
MKNSRFNRGLAVLLVASTTFVVQNVAAAADSNEQSPKGTPHQKSTLNHADDYESSSWDRNPRFDRFDGARLIQSQFAPAPYCYTFAGPVCSMNVALPAGYPCTCFYSGGSLPGRTGF